MAPTEVTETVFDFWISEWQENVENYAMQWIKDLLIE